MVVIKDVPKSRLSHFSPHRIELHFEDRCGHVACGWWDLSRGDMSLLREHLKCQHMPPLPPAPVIADTRVEMGSGSWGDSDECGLRTDLVRRVVGAGGTFHPLRLWMLCMASAAASPSWLMQSPREKTQVQKEWAHLYACVFMCLRHFWKKARGT